MRVVLDTHLLSDPQATTFLGRLRSMPCRWRYDCLVLHRSVASVIMELGICD